MSTTILNHPERYCLDIRGQFNRPGLQPLIFQHSNGGRQKKLGPIFPTNPQTRAQQMNRIVFTAATRQASLLSEDTKQLYKQRIPKHKRSRIWRHEFISNACQIAPLGKRRLGEGLLGTPKALRPTFRLGEFQLGDAFLCRLADLPIDKTALRTAYATINISSLFP